MADSISLYHALSFQYEGLEIGQQVNIMGSLSIKGLPMPR